MKKIPLFLIFITLILTSSLCTNDPKDDPDPLPPDVFIHFLADGMEVPADFNMSIPAEAISENGGISSMAMTVDGIIVESVQQSAHCFSWNTEGMSTGEYLLEIIAEDSEGITGSAELKINLMDPVGPPGLCEDSPTFHYQGYDYKVVRIGEQCWFAENFRYNCEGSSCYDNDQINCEVYGRLYDWWSAFENAPEGWHLPSVEEWCDLLSYVDPDSECMLDAEVGTDVGFKLRSADGWADCTSGSDQYHFRVLPAGYTWITGEFTRMGGAAIFLTSSVTSNDFIYHIGFNDVTTKAGIYTSPKSLRLSVRYVKD